MSSHSQQDRTGQDYRRERRRVTHARTMIEPKAETHSASASAMAPPPEKKLFYREDRGNVSDAGRNLRVEGTYERESPNTSYMATIFGKALPRSER